MIRPWYSWGVDGHGVRHYQCRHCEMYFGPVNIDKVVHHCDKSKPKGHNRGVVAIKSTGKGLNENESIAYSK